jgi:hypothetical protein
MIPEEYMGYEQEQGGAVKSSFNIETDEEDDKVSCNNKDEVSYYDSDDEYELYDGTKDEDEFLEPGSEAFNVEKGSKLEEVLSCEHQKDWKEEWLIGSGSNVNVTNKKERF